MAQVYGSRHAGVKLYLIVSEIETKKADNIDFLKQGKLLLPSGNVIVKGLVYLCSKIINLSITSNPFYPKEYCHWHPDILHLHE